MVRAVSQVLNRLSLMVTAVSQLFTGMSLMMNSISLLLNCLPLWTNVHVFELINALLHEQHKSTNIEKFRGHVGRMSCRGCRGLDVPLNVAWVQL